MKARVFTDSAPILERLWAKEAGPWFYWQNAFISREHGLHNLIGIILVDVEMDYSLSLDIREVAVLVVDVWMLVLLEHCLNHLLSILGNASISDD